MYAPTTTRITTAPYSSDMEGPRWRASIQTTSQGDQPRPTKATKTANATKATLDHPDHPDGLDDPDDLDDLVEPGHRRTVAGVPERLQLGIPRGAEQPFDGVLVVLSGAGRREQRPHLLLTDDYVAVRADRRAEDAPAGDVRDPFAVTAGTGFLGDLEPQHRPRSKLRGDLGGRADTA